MGCKCEAVYKAAIAADRAGVDIADVAFICKRCHMVYSGTIPDLKPD